MAISWLLWPYPMMQTAGVAARSLAI